jgi:crescentin
MTVVDRGGPLLKRRMPSLQVAAAEFDSTSAEIEIEQAKALDGARAEIARLERRLSLETTAARALRKRVQTSVAAVEAAEKRAAELETEFGAVRQHQETLDVVAADNARLSQSLAEKDTALADVQARIRFLATALAAAEAEAGGKRAEGLENGCRAASDQLAGKRDLVTAENARLSQSAIAKDVALGDARARLEFLETALSAAEAECARLTAELGGAREKQRSESENLNGRLEAMSSRAVTAEKLLAEARERLLARIVEIDAFRQRAADAKAANNEAYAKTRQLEDALCLRHCQVDDLERSHSALIKATKTLLETFQDRDRALVGAEAKIKFLAERNAQLEAGANRANGQDGSDGCNIGRLTVDDADDTSRKAWAELACLLRDFVERKRQSCGQDQVRSMTLLAGTVTF